MITSGASQMKNIRLEFDVEWCNVSGVVPNSRSLSGPPQPGECPQQEIGEICGLVGAAESQAETDVGC